MVLILCLKFQMSNFVEDDTIFCLISIIILFSVDEIESIQDHSYCEEQRLHFLFLLQKYLASKNNKSVARKKMTNAVNVISYGRELEQLSVNKCQGLLSECKMYP